ncbi:(Lyso)-N-acylphosphatidylethanolamine lipase isoform X1 [Diorhabda carinulata]|uniref:(Lyso)-N-acylphosphatidylethanolamine lipase isoform X1 n=2 Tax=Diorhabda carinulata TaxID=1163345 RepID=UPI0025A1B612|nr:(Lyso)-N-acylphosphatidylethanolamine lipase isoform X1 [Diorhabda carinulata]
MRFSRLFYLMLSPFSNVISKVYYGIAITVLSWISPNWLSWNKFSESMLRSLEKRILSIVKSPHKGFFVDVGPVVGPADKIWTISLNTQSQKTPLVLIHGLGSGVALWCLNLDAFAATRPVYAFDVLGFGRSSRPQFSTSCTEAENQMIKSIEEWRKELKLKEIILLGHSMGGFLATSYAISYPSRVKNLILADPWGFPERPKEYTKVPLWIKTVATIMKPFNPLAGIRVAGPLGPWFINTIRPDISKKYAAALEDASLIPDYIYQCNCQYPSGEGAYHAMMADFGWAKNPMVNRIDKLDPSIPITLLYGSRSWIDNSAGEIIKNKRKQSVVRLQVVTGAGHHVYADKPEAFNQIVLEACTYMENPTLAIQLSRTESDKPESDSQ